jgi:trk system potassium uptake protein TrkA
MKVVVIGAGQVGSSVSRRLCEEGNDVTVVDNDFRALSMLQQRYDLKVIEGHGSHPHVLEDAGIEDADMLVAVTSNDEVNMIACYLSYTLHRTPKRIARVRGLPYQNYHTNIFSKKMLPIDVLINPEQLVTDHIKALITHPGAFQVLDFSKGRVGLVGVRADQDGDMNGHALKDLAEHLPNIETRVAAIFREGKSIDPRGDTVITEGDEVFFLSDRQNIRKLMKEWRSKEDDADHIMIAGGGNIGSRLAQSLQKKHRVKLIERDPDNARKITEFLDNTVVLTGDAADEALLKDENIADIDVFCSVTNDDEANILSAMLAKKFGAKKVMALVNRLAYVDMISASGTIDLVISPQQATIGSILSQIRRGDVAKVHSIRRGEGEAIEAVAHGDEKTSQVVGRSIKELGLPSTVKIGAIVRNEKVLIAHGDTVIEEDDHVILFIVSKKDIPYVEKLFQVSAGFF